MIRGTANHPKVFLLCKELGCSRPTALGYLTLLWEFASNYAQDGNVSRYPDYRIEAAMDWKGKPGKLITALLLSGWLDVHEQLGYCVHDWHLHSEKSVKRYLARHNIPFVIAQSVRR